MPRTIPKTKTRSKSATSTLAQASDISEPGVVVRQVRTERNLTLADVSKLTGLPVSTLSKIETGKMPLNYSKLLSISRGLDLDITRLFAPEVAHVPAEPAANLPTGFRSITRAECGPAIRTSTYEYVYPAADLLRKSLNPMILDIKVRSIEDFGELMRHPGDEYAMVLEGQCEFHCDLYAPVDLMQGDSIYFSGTMGHAYVATGDGPCRILCVCSASTEELNPFVRPLE